MIRTLIALVAVMALVGGCGMFGKKSTPQQSALTDVAPPPSPSHGPTTPVTVVPVTSDVASPADAAAPAAGQKYTVKKGDTLWSLAAKTYGNGTQYKKIESANPSIKNGRINVGQTITLPQ
jgi:nucleoid-associated protein YgaU